jgi:transposase
MGDLIWLSEAQMRRIEPYFPLSHGVPRVDDRRIVSRIIFIIRNGLRWGDAPAAYGPPKTIYTLVSSSKVTTQLGIARSTPLGSTRQSPLGQRSSCDL